MITAYKLAGIYYDGTSIQLNVGDPVPTNYTLIPIPDVLCPGQYATLPAGATEAVIINTPPPDPVISLTKYEFRKLFTLSERISIDNVQNNTTIPANAKAALVTMTIDLNLSGLVFLNNPDVISGVTLLEQVGLIAAGRAAMVLSNTPPV